IFAIFEKQRPPTNRSDPVGEQRADRTADRTIDTNPDRVKGAATLRLNKHPSRQRECHLAWQRNTGALDRHCDHDAGPSVGGKKVREDLDDGVFDGCHAGISPVKSLIAPLERRTLGGMPSAATRWT